MFERQPEMTGRPATVRKVDDLQHRAVRSTFAGLLARGLSAGEAANVTAYLSGVSPSQQQWDVNQVSHLVFLRVLVENGEFGPLDGEDDRPGAPFVCSREAAAGPG